jgi:hypothetical protein
VACIGADGKIKNGTAQEVCEAVLPKCSELVSGNSKQVRRMLSMKIMGYYKGMDLDIDKSTKDNLVGGPLSVPVCSVVGHDLSKTGDEELWKQTVGARASCGRLPFMTGKSGSKRIYFRFQGDEGLAWSSWMMGAYPWGIRSAAYDVFQELKPDLSNLDQVIKSDVMKARKDDYSATEAAARKFYRDLDPAAKAVCDSGATDIKKKCTEGGFSVTDPAIRICTLLRAQLSMGGGALSNLLAGEIVARTQKRHDDMFKSVIVNEIRPGSSTHGMMNQLMYACNRYTEGARLPGGAGCGMERRRYLATVGSCFGKGTRYRTWADWHVDEGESWTCFREGSRKSQFNLVTGKITTNKGVWGDGMSKFVTTPVVAAMGPTSGGGSAAFTRQNGFASGIEFLIRRVLCGATRNNQSTPRCDISEATGIPDKPSDMSW